MLSYAEKQITECANVIELLCMRASEQPDDLAYTFLADGEVEADSFTYAQLDQHARALGALLQHLNGAGERALMIYPSSIDTIAGFLGCLYGGAIAVPVVPPQPNRAARTLPRLQTVVEDAGARFVLTTSALLQEIEKVVDRFPQLKQMEWIATDLIDTSLAADWRQPDITRDMLAYLQYTSGSTSAPKGVMISHANLMNICEYDSHILGYRQREGAAVCWVPYFHDYGLIEGLMVPLYNGIPCYVMCPMSFVQKPFRWLQAISRYRATNSCGPNFAYDLCVRKTTPEQRATLDLSCWRSASNAAEPIHKKTLERFVETFAPQGFTWDQCSPAYGLAEATLIISSRQGPVFYSLQADELEQDKIVAATEDDTNVRAVVGCGQVATEMFKTRVRIADPVTMEQSPPDRIGEIWIGGELVAQGYWEKPEETARTFQAYLADTGEGPFLRTGDLGFVKDGEVIVTGRLKDLIIIEGRNHYPQDIEKTVEDTHPALHAGCSAAFSVTVDRQERLVVAVEVTRNYRPLTEGSTEEPTGNVEGVQVLDTKKLLKQVRAAVAEEHDILLSELVLLKTGTINKTSSGKIQRQACRADYLNQTLDLWLGSQDNKSAGDGSLGQWQNFTN